MALKNLFDMVKADRYTADGREAIIKAQEAETEDATRRTYQIGEISQSTGLQKTANGWVKPKNGAGRSHGIEQKKRGPGAIHTPGKGSVGIDKMKEAAEKGLKGQELKEFMTGSKSENKTTIRQGPNTKTLNETPAEHVQKNLDAYTGYSPYDMEELVLKPSGYEKSRSTKGPDGVSSITYKKDGGDDIVLFFDKYGELKNAGTSQNREGVMQKMRAAEGYGHMKVVGDYDVYRVTSGPEKGKYKISKVGSLKEVTMSEEKAADFLTSATGKNKATNKDSAPSLSEIVDRVYNIGEISEKTGLQKTANGWVKPKKGAAPAKKEPKKGAGIPQATTETFVGKTYKDFVESATPSGYKPTKNTDNPDGSSTTVFEKEGKQIKVEFDKNGKITKVSPGEEPGPDRDDSPEREAYERELSRQQAQRAEDDPRGFGYEEPPMEPAAESKPAESNRENRINEYWKNIRKGTHPVARMAAELDRGTFDDDVINTMGDGQSMEDLARSLISPAFEDVGYIPQDKLDTARKIIRKRYRALESDATDAAPRVLTGDCRIRLRKEKPALTGNTKIRVRK